MLLLVAVNGYFRQNPPTTLLKRVSKRWMITLVLKRLVIGSVVCRLAVGLTLILGDCNLQPFACQDAYSTFFATAYQQGSLIPKKISHPLIHAPPHAS